MQRNDMYDYEEYGPFELIITSILAAILVMGIYGCYILVTSRTISKWNWECSQEKNLECSQWTKKEVL